MNRLRRTLHTRIGRTSLSWDYMVKLWSAAIVGAVVAWLVKLALPSVHPAIAGALILGTYGVVFLGATLLMRIPEASSAVSRLKRRV